MLRWLFIDMNSYFASVEQQLCPELRGKPVAVVAVETDSTSCIAASYEAKAFGVRTGTHVGLARHLCPGLQIVVARPPVYVDFHHRIVDVVENHLHVEKVLSIDEMACLLPSNENSVERAVGIARAIKKSLYDKLGAWTRSSIGIAPNRFLSKVASDMQKPDGLVVLRKEELPGRLFSLGVRDLPGVGRNMEVRLAAGGANTMRAIWEMSADQLARAWGGIGGRQLWHNLHGDEVHEAETQRRSIGHSNVLAPEWRNAEGAYAVLVRLVHKAAARLRDMKYAARHMSLHVHFEDHSSWGDYAWVDDGQDTQTLIEAMEEMWKRRAAGTPKKVGITLYNLERVGNLTMPLFGRDVHGRGRRMELAHAMDRINAKFGRQTLYFGEMHATRKAAPRRIAFNSVPDEDW